MITAQQLRELLDYDPLTGAFRWKVARGGRGGGRAGSVAGGLSKIGYWRIGIFGTRYYAHRLAWLYVHGRWPREQIDHINGDRADNRIENLREVTNQENHKNMPVAPTNTTGHCGVYRSRRGRWVAQIKIRSKSRHLGTFDTKDEAIEARRKAAARHGFTQHHGSRRRKPIQLPGWAKSE